MLHKRIMVRLCVRDGRVTDDVRRAGLGDPRDPAELAARYAADGADGIVLQDDSATHDGHRRFLEALRRTAGSLNVPLTAATGVADVSGIAQVLRTGADRVCLGGAVLARPDLLREAAQQFGSGRIVAGIEAKVERRRGEVSADHVKPGASPYDEIAVAVDWYRVFTQGGSTPTDRNAIAWARECVDLGAGEIMLRSLGRGDEPMGFDLELTARVVEWVDVPVVAVGDGARVEDMRDAFVIAGADAVLASGLFHEGALGIGEVKRVLAAADIPVRLADAREVQAPGGERAEGDSAAAASSL